MDMQIDSNNMPTKVGMIILKNIKDKLKRDKKTVTIQSISEEIEKKTTEYQRKRNKVYTTNQIMIGICVLDLTEGLYE